MNCKVVKFKIRNPNEASNKNLAEIYVNGPKFDIDLIAADQKIVSAHKFVVFMYSRYLKQYLCEFKPKGKPSGSYSIRKVLFQSVYCKLFDANRFSLC